MIRSSIKGYALILALTSVCSLSLAANSPTRHGEARIGASFSVNKIEFPEGFSFSSSGNQSSINSSGDLALYSSGTIVHIAADGTGNIIAPSSNFPNIVPDLISTGASSNIPLLRLKVTDQRIIFFSGYIAGSRKKNRIFAYNIVTGSLSEHVIGGDPTFDPPPSLPPEEPLIGMQVAHSGTVVYSRKYLQTGFQGARTDIWKVDFDGNGFVNERIVRSHEDGASERDFGIDQEGNAYFLAGTGASSGVYREGGSSPILQFNDACLNNRDSRMGNFFWWVVGNPNELFVRCDGAVSLPSVPGGIFRINSSQTLTQMVSSGANFGPLQVYALTQGRLVSDANVYGASKANFYAGFGAGQFGSFDGPDPSANKIIGAGDSIRLSGEIVNSQVLDGGIYAISAKGPFFGWANLEGLGGTWFTGFDCQGAGLCMEIAQTIYEPDLYDDGIVDLVNKKSATVIAKFFDRTSGLPLANHPISNASAKIGALPGILHLNNSTTNEKGELFFDFSPVLVPSSEFGNVSNAEVSGEVDGEQLEVIRQVVVNKTSEFFVGYYPVHSPCIIEFACYLSTSKNSVELHALQSDQFMRATFPVPDVPERGVYVSEQQFPGNAYDPINKKRGFETDRDDLLKIKSVSLLNGNVSLDRVTAIVSGPTFGVSSYFEYANRIDCDESPGSPGERIKCNSAQVGAAPIAGRIAVIQNGVFAAGAHELGHSLCNAFNGRSGCATDPLLTSADFSAWIHENPANLVDGFRTHFDSSFFGGYGPVDGRIPLMRYGLSSNEANAALWGMEGASSVWIDRASYLNMLFRLLRNPDSHGRAGRVKIYSFAADIVVDASEGQLELKSLIKVQNVEVLPQSEGRFRISGFDRSNNLVFETYSDFVTDRIEEEARTSLVASIPLDLNVERVVIEDLQASFQSIVFRPNIEAIKTLMTLIPKAGFSTSTPDKFIDNVFSELARIGQMYDAGSVVSGDRGLTKLIGSVSASLKPVFASSSPVHLNQVGTVSSVSVTAASIALISKSNNLNPFFEIDSTPIFLEEGRVQFHGRILTHPGSGYRILLTSVADNKAATLKVDGNNFTILTQPILAPNFVLSVDSFIVERRSERTLLNARRTIQMNIAHAYKELEEAVDPALIKVLKAKIIKDESKVLEIDRKVLSMRKKVGNTFSKVIGE